MSVEAPMRLPPEVIFHVIRNIVPSAQPGRIPYPPSDPITKTLLALTQVSTLTYSEAIRLLYRYCTWIDTIPRLQCFARSLADAAGIKHIPKGKKSDWPQQSIFAMSLITEVVSTSSCSKIWSPRMKEVRGNKLHQYITSLYIRPSSESKDAAEYKKLEVIQSLYDLFYLVAPTLKHLVLDLPRWLMRETTWVGSALPSLQAVFTQLTALETFGSMEDDFFLQTGFLEHEGDPPVWRTWSNLHTLIVTDARLKKVYFWQNLKTLPGLQTLIIALNGGFTADAAQAMWAEKVPNSETFPLKIVLVSRWEDSVLRGEESWTAGEISFTLVHLRVSPSSGESSEDQVIKMIIEGEEFAD